MHLVLDKMSHNLVLIINNPSKRGDVNNPFEIDPLTIDKVIVMFIVWILVSEWKKVQYGKAIDRRKKKMIKWDTNGDSLTKKCIVLFISFHEKMLIQK